METGWFGRPPISLINQEYTMYGYVYLTKNLQNNKIYIGLHRATSFDNSYYGTGVLILKALAKYGKQNFIRIMLAECQNEEELNKTEEFYIAYFNSTNEAIGYNIEIGGKSTPLSERTKEKIRLKNKANPSRGMLGKSQSDFQKQRAREARLGYVVSDETRKLISEASIGNTYASACSGYVWVYKEQISHQIPESKVSSYLEEGFKLGRPELTAEQFQHYKDIYADRIFVNNQVEERYIHPEELETLLQQGFTVGRLAYSKDRIMKSAASRRGTIRIEKDGRFKLVKPELVTDYEKQGWVRYIKKSS